MKNPIAFLVFNRPECTARTFAAIREARPPRLLIIADGPRETHPHDVEKCMAVRALIDQGVDWPCIVERNYAPGNLGCAKRVAGGLTWAFERAEQLVVVEDDCLPDNSFFEFCDELLFRYSADTRVGQICGCSRYVSNVDRNTSYIFSRYGPIWGWASWRRAWSTYDLAMATWPRFRAMKGLDGVTQSPAEAKFRTSLYDELYTRDSSCTWDFQWGYAKLSQGLLSIIPTQNLITNIGDGADATHPVGRSSFHLTSHSMNRPLIHPEFVLPDQEFDRMFSSKLTPHWAGSIRSAWGRIRLTLNKQKGGR